MELAGFFLAIVVAVFIGVALNRKIKSTSVWLRYSVVWIVAICVWFVVFALFLPSNQATKGKNKVAQSSNPAPLKTPNVKKETPSKSPTDSYAKARAEVEMRPELDVTPGQLQKNLNDILASIGGDADVDITVTHTKEAADSASATLSKYAELTGVVKQSDQHFTSVTVIGAGDGTSLSGLSILLSAAEMFAAVNPQLTIKQALPLVNRLLADAENHKGEAKYSKTVGEVRYVFMPSKAVGSWFIAEPASATK